MDRPVNEDASIFWNNVKTMIRIQNTTHEWVAKQAGISFNTFQGWIAKGIFPRVNEANKIAEVLGVSLDFLMQRNPDYARVFSRFGFDDLKDSFSSVKESIQGIFGFTDVHLSQEETEELRKEWQRKQDNLDKDFEDIKENFSNLKKSIGKALKDWL